MNLSEQLYKTSSKMTSKEIDETLNNLDDELRTTRVDLCEICGKKVWFWNKFEGFGATYHKKCIDTRIKSNTNKRGKHG